MARSKSEIDDLKDLQREAAELREKSRQARATEEPESDEQADPETEPDEALDEDSDPGDEGQLSEQVEDVEGVAVHIDKVIQEVEALARKHPSLVLVSAFTVGFMAGKLFTRR